MLKPLCQRVPRFIRDDMDFLNYIPDTVQPDTLIVSFDVTSLYTNIPHNLGIEAVNFWLQTRPEEINGIFPKQFILEGLKIVLENTIKG